MCGIIGIASNKLVTSNIIQSLKKLEYRGYDSAGIATIVNGEINEKYKTFSIIYIGENANFRLPSDIQTALTFCHKMIIQFCKKRLKDKEFYFQMNFNDIFGSRPPPLYP